MEKHAVFPHYHKDPFLWAPLVTSAQSEGVVTDRCWCVRGGDIVEKQNDRSHFLCDNKIKTCLFSLSISLLTDLF